MYSYVRIQVAHDNYIHAVLSSTTYTYLYSHGCWVEGYIQ